MTKTPKKIYFVHEGKAAYPEIAAYRHYFEGLYETEEIKPEDLASHPDLADSIAWHIMGFYRQRPAAALVIHDYRSLSVGRFSRLKDFVKRQLNARPDIRIFQNVAMRDMMGFRDHVPATLLPMGVPPFVLESRSDEVVVPTFDFAYIGVMSRERRTQDMIDSFLKRFGARKTFRLYGTPEPEIVERYKGRANIIFAGQLPQYELFRVLREARVAVNYFPMHFPHRLQTPTKLLEYAALGLRVLSNEQPQSRLTAETYALRSLWGPAHDMFRDVPDKLDWPSNAGLDPSPFLWPAVIAGSEIARLIEKVLAR